MALASPRTSAQIIALPGAAAAPVVNPKRRLRYSTADRNVKNIAKQRVDRAWRLRQEPSAPPQRSVTGARPFNPVRDRFCGVFAMAVNSLSNDALAKATQCMLRHMSALQRMEAASLYGVPERTVRHD